VFKYFTHKRIFLKKLTKIAEKISVSVIFQLNIIGSHHHRGICEKKTHMQQNNNVIMQ